MLGPASRRARSAKREADVAIAQRWAIYWLLASVCCLVGSSVAGALATPIYEDTPRLPRFIGRFVLASIMSVKYQWLKTHLESEFREYHEKRARSAAEPEFEESSGTEFETYLARLLKQSGFENIRGTAATGDQGADLLATKANRTIVIQAKRYRGSVGNKAVQEVVAAVKFYSADEGWVITSGTFTMSAKALAQAKPSKTD